MARVSVFAIFLTCVFAAAQSPAPNLTSQEIVARSLAAVAPQEVLAGRKSVKCKGTILLTSERGDSNGEGTATLDSQGINVKFESKFDTASYPGDRFVYDGKQVSAPRYWDWRSNTSRTTMGALVVFQSSILSKGVFGGVLSTAWPLYDAKLRGVKLTYTGVKKMDGVSLLEMVLTPDRASDALQIRLYFEPETFRHVSTVYRVKMPPDTGFLPRVLPTRSVITYYWQESFGDFREVGGYVLPFRHHLMITDDTGRVGTRHFDIRYNEITVNQPTP